MENNFQKSDFLKLHNLIKKNNILYHDKINSADLTFPGFGKHHPVQGTSYANLDVFEELKEPTEYL